MKKAIVTGGAGFIGSNLVDLLIENKFEVVVIDNISTGKLENINPRAKFYQENISNFENIQNIFEKEKPTFVFHLAARINVRESIEKPIEYSMQNIISTINLLELCVKNKVEHFVFSSTGGAIYGDGSEIPTPETSPSFPMSPYGCSKYAIEKYLIYYSRVKGLKFTCLRYANVYGPRQNPEGEAGVISIFFQKMFEKKPISIFGGIQTRDFVYVKDVARANLLALQDTKSNVYNIGTGKETDIIEIFNKINKYFGNSFSPEYKPMISGEQKRSCLNYAKIKEHLKWSPRTTLTEGLNNTYCWYLASIKNH